MPSIKEFVANIYNLSAKSIKFSIKDKTSWLCGCLIVFVQLEFLTSKLHTNDVISQKNFPSHFSLHNVHYI